MPEARLQRTRDAYDDEDFLTPEERAEAVRTREQVERLALGALVRHRFPITRYYREQGVMLD